MPRKKQGGLDAMTEKPGEEIPYAAIEEAATKMTHCVVKIDRHSPKGRWATVVSSAKMLVMNLSAIDSAIKQMSGGGRYLVRTFTSAQRMGSLVPPFYVQIEGIPLPTPVDAAARLDLVAAGFTGNIAGPAVAASAFSSPTTVAPFAPGSQGESAPASAASDPLYRSLLDSSSAYSAPMQGQPDMSRAYIPLAPPATGQPFMQGHPSVGLHAPPWPADSPGWVHDYPFDQQWEMFRNMHANHPSARMSQQQMNPPPYLQQQLQMQQQQMQQAQQGGGTIASDRLAMYHAQREREQLTEVARKLERLEAERTAERKQFEATIEQNRKDRERSDRELEHARLKQEREADQARMKHEMDLLRLQMQQSGNQPKPQGVQEIVAALAPFAPVFATMVQSNASRETERMKMLLGPAKKEPDSTMELMKVLLPLAIPLLADWLKQRGPEAQSEAHAAAVQNQMMLLKMMHDMIAAQAEGSGNEVWRPILDSVMSTIQGWAAMQQAKAAQAAGLPQMSAGPQVQQLPSPQEVSGREDPIPEPQPSDTWEQLQKIDHNAAMLTQAIWDHPSFAAELKTNDWKMVIFKVHAQRDPHKTAHEAAVTVVKLVKTGTAQELVRSVYVDPQRLGLIITQLPIWEMNRAWAETFLNNFIAMINSTKPVPAAQAVVTPPPVNGTNGHQAVAAEPEEEYEDAEYDEAINSHL